MTNKYTVNVFCHLRKRYKYNYVKFSVKRAEKEKIVKDQQICRFC